METIKRKSLLYPSKIEFEDGVWVINHVEGCSHGCKYPCYAQLIKRKDYETWCKPKLVENTLELLDKEIPKYKDKIKRVHLCFSTDPFMYGQPEVIELTFGIMVKLLENKIPYKILTKGVLPWLHIDGYEDQYNNGTMNQYGISLVSLDESFREKFEPFTAPYAKRINSLSFLDGCGLYTYIYMEPFSPEITSFEEFKKLLNEINFVKKIYFGSWQYNKVYKDKSEFQKYIDYIADFCKERDIELKLKKEIAYL